MLNAIITANDQTAIIEFPIDQFDLYKQLGQIGIRKGPHKIPLTDDEDAEIQVKLYADNDFGNHVIRLFHERDTLDDVHTAVGAIDIASDDVKEQLEEYILHDQLEGTGHLYNTIREIKEAIAPIVTTFYCPLTAQVHDDEYGDMNDVGDYEIRAAQYVEACMGSAEVFLRKRPSEREIINDYNGDLVKFFRVLQRSEKLAYLIGRLYLSFNSEQLFKANKAMLADVPNILDDLTETSVIIENADWSDIEKAVAFFENQIFSFSSTGKTFAIAKKDMTKRFGRLVAACSRLRNAVIMHRDYKDCIAYAAGKDTFILLDPPYKGTENYYQKASFGSDEHAMLFEFMNGVHEKYKGECKFIITYNNDPYIVDLANKYGFDTYVQKRLHNMAQSTKPGEMFEELLIGNFNLLDQAELNNKYLLEQTRQLTLFDFQYDY